MNALDLLSLLDDSLYDALPYALVCLGLLWTAKYIRFPDLTCSGTFVLGGALAAVAIVKGGWSPVTATAVAVIGGIAGGLLTGLFYVGLRMDRILAGILSAFVLYSANLLLLTPTLPYQGHSTLFSLPESWDREVITSGYAVSWHPWLIIFLLIIVVVVKALMDWFLSSEMGLALRALEDEEAGEPVLLRQGLSPNSFRILALAIGNGIVALAGALVSFKESAANAHRGFDVLITGLIAFLLGMQIHKLLHGVAHWVGAGGGSLFDRFLRIRFSTAAALGALAYFFLLTVSQRVKVDADYAKIVLALLVALSVVDPTMMRRLRWRRNDQSHVPPMASGALLWVDELRFRYPAADTDTLCGISFSMGPDEFLRLRGGNGSGKTTALRIIAGFLEAKQGSQIIYDGRDFSHDARARLRHIAYVDQNASRGVVSVLTTEENLALASCGSHPSLWRQGLSRNRSPKLRGILIAGGVHERIFKLPARFLSGGQKQVVNLLTLLARQDKPKLVLLDEPANNLDLANQAHCRRIINGLREQGVAVVLVSHLDLHDISIEKEIDLDQINHPQPSTAREAALSQVAALER